MTRFIRNLLIAQFVVFLATQYAMVWLALPLAVWLGIDPQAPFGFCWQWATHSLVELPGQGALLGFGIYAYVAWLTYPRIEATYGRAWLVGALAGTTAAAGILGLLVAWLYPPPLPGAGAFTLVLGTWAFDAWARRNAGPSAVSFFPGTAVFSVTGPQMIAGLVAFALVRLIVSRLLVDFALDVGATGGGVLVALFREQRLARASSRRAFGVIHGGRGGPGGRDGRGGNSPRDLH